MLPSSIDKLWVHPVDLPWPGAQLLLWDKYSLDHTAQHGLPLKELDIVVGNFCFPPQAFLT